MFRIKPLNITQIYGDNSIISKFFLPFPIISVHVLSRKFHSPWLPMAPRMIRMVAPPLALAASCGAKRSSRLLVIDGGGL